MKRDLEQFKDDILTACDRIAEHIKGYVKDMFLLRKSQFQIGRSRERSIILAH